MGLAAGQRLYFRARLDDKVGSVGEWTPVATGTASSDASQILDYLEGQITSGRLAAGLLEQIEKIPGIEQGLSDNAQAILAEAQARQAAITSEQSARQTADESLAQDIQQVSAAVDNTAAAVQQEATTRADADTAL